MWKILCGYWVNQNEKYFYHGVTRSFAQSFTEYSICLRVTLCLTPRNSVVKIYYLELFSNNFQPFTI